MAALVRELAESTGLGAVYYTEGPDGLSVAAAWPEHPSGPVPGVAVQVPGGGVLVLVAVSLGSADMDRLRRFADRIALAAAGERLRAEQDRQRSRTRALEREVLTARERLVHVRDLERRRIAGALTGVIGRDFAQLRSRLEAGELAEFRTTLDDVIDRFRTVVRGVHPAMLPERGPLAALEELAATLPRPVRFAGDLGRRAGWEVESGLYHAAAAVLALLAENACVQPVQVSCSREDGLLSLTFVDPSSAVVDLRSALRDDAARLSAFGGTLETWDEGGTATIRVRLPERFDVAAIEPVGLLARVREVVAAGVRASVAGWSELAELLDRPPVVALVGPGSTAAVESLTGHEVLRHLTLTDTPAEADVVLALDSTMDLVHPTVSHVDDPSPALPDLLYRRVVDRADLLAARGVLTAARQTPQPEPLARLLDQVLADAHELVELDLVDALESGTTALHALTTEALRLLGASGRAPHTRLGLPRHAPPADIRTAAATATTAWRTHAGNPALSTRAHEACLTVVRTCEGLAMG
ncbi:hypothetical protein V5P93_002785 [Actinokineospora auranticolor]|uniref:Signal transduction histidine kinase n=1 Tax=Actinokineospora auranticolor TaxID=155976 RepID=A0A2S6H0H8_9PSEU|nr:hypothetical protein [Actinokineospora auranticolor]PPK70926.1 signal transduction histidine kinase [Actinokineospora auranticolor]